ncbi:MAG: hypothetical protein IJW13_00435 [Clostridia bacterium]|nr:hypothetical protein [Clostridia bacterium]
MSFSPSSYLLPIFILLSLIFAFFKKIDLYDGFASGVNGAIGLVFDIFPYVTTVIIMTELMQASGLYGIIEIALKPIFDFCGVPTQVCSLLLFKPFSGSASIATLNEIFTLYGADSYIGKCAACIFGSSETVFYIGAVYFSKCKNKRLKVPIIISLLSTFISCIFACFICKFI